MKMMQARAENRKVVDKWSTEKARILYAHVAKMEAVTGHGRWKVCRRGDSLNKKLIFPMVAHQFQWWYRRKNA